MRSAVPSGSPCRSRSSSPYSPSAAGCSAARRRGSRRTFELHGGAGAGAGRGARRARPPVGGGPAPTRAAARGGVLPAARRPHGGLGLLEAHLPAAHRQAPGDQGAPRAGRAPRLMAPGVTVAIPVYNGARYLDEVLAAVRAQRVDREFELLIVDSGSTDGSLDIARRHGARIHEIPKAEFSHGGTRNLAMQLAEGEHVAFLTQDATPAHDGWLAALLEGFEQAADVALVFGPHDPRPDASHMIKCEMERHFGTFGDGGIDVQRLGRSSTEIAAYRRFPGRLSFFSDVNGCVAKWAW